MRFRHAAAATVLGGLIALSLAATAGPLAVVATSGVSMQPRISAGDLVVTAPSATYRVGDAVAYRSAELRTVVLHRIVALERERFVFQGDNNDFLDPERLPASAIVGKELLHIPRGGIWLHRLTSPPALAAYTFLLLTAGTAAARTKRQRRQERRTMSPRNRYAAASLLGALPPALRPVATTAALIGVVGIALGGVSWTRATTTTGADPTSVGSSMDFSYTAAVPASAAYDGTTVTAPQPVFRTLTDTVDVTYDYSGRPGTIAVDARLSASSGWTSTLPLAPQASLKAQQQGTVRLDLPALERRAEAAAAVTGIPTGSLTIAVAPRITMDDGSEFSPEVVLALDSLSLKPASQEEFTAATSSRVKGTAPAQISALTKSMDVQVVRAASLAAILLATLLGLGLLALTRLRGPVAEADRIRARHRSLLLPVLPIVLTPGRPVVDVPDMAALATLAERYGLLVLHWERSGVTTYVVQDEATTYRYRTNVVHEARDPVEEGMVASPD